MNANDMHALRLLDVHGPLGPAELGRRLDLRSASITVLLDRLEAGGLIERVRDINDRRRVAVRILPHAAHQMFEAWAPIVRAMDAAGRSFSKSDQRTICTFIDSITAVAQDDIVTYECRSVMRQLRLPSVHRLPPAPL
jgi:DNA-binding MarR family transcriptional regulator